jgi:tricorn protease
VARLIPTTCSRGDAFPHYFPLKGLGPLIGKRTWGGLVGISHESPLVDDSSVTMPDFEMWDPKSENWVVENHVVDFDIDLENSPDALVASVQGAAQA